MKQTTYGVVGHKGKLGSLLVERPNFVSVDCDITNLISIQRAQREVAVLVNCAGISSVEACEKNATQAFESNMRGADNLMRVYGNRVLNISSDHVFPGWWLFPPKETTKPFPTNVYGILKMAMEDLTINTYGAKVIRLSRTIDNGDADIYEPLQALYFGRYVNVPAFFHRNYLTRSQAVDGIEYFVKNFNQMPPIINYGSSKSISFHSLISEIAKKDNLSTHLLGKRNKYDSKPAPRPKKSGFSVQLAKKLNFPIYSLGEVIRGI